MKAKDFNLALRAGELTQREAARLLGIDERTVRRYASGKVPIPPAIWLAVDHLVDCMEGDAIDEHLKEIKAQAAAGKRK